MSDRATREEAPFQRDMAAGGGYLYTTNAPWSARVALERQTEEVLRAADFAGRSVLDVGCGDGAMTLDLYDRGGAERIEAIDPAANAISVAASRRGDRRIQFSVCSAYELPFPDQAFDIAHLRGVLHHMDRPEAAISEAARVARTVVVLEPNGLNPVMKLIEKVSPYHRAHGERSFRPGQLRQWMENAGLSVAFDSFSCLVPYFCPEPVARLLKRLEPVVEKTPLIRAVGCGTYTLTAVRRDERAAAGAKPCRPSAAD